MQARSTSLPALAVFLGAASFSIPSLAQPAAPPPPPAAAPSPPAAQPSPPAAQPLPAAQPPPAAPPGPPVMPPGAAPAPPGAPPYPPPPGWGPPPAAGPPAEAPPADAPPKRDGVSAKGLPNSMRGGIIADFGALHLADTETPVAAIDVIARVPITDHTFFDAALPIGFGAIGNPMIGAHHVIRVSDPVWISIGGSLGFPIINSTQFQSFALARALWDYQEFASHTMPFAARFGLEAHAGIAEFRVQLEPVWGVALKSTPDYYTSNAEGHFFAVQHAFEAQIGHAIGGGVRYQGVIFATDTLGNGGSGDADRYQGALELFFRLYRDPIFARVGFLVPLDTPLGQIDGKRNWGFRAQTGFTLD